MKHLLCIIAFVVSSLATYGQRTEFSVQVGTGLFSFRGPGAVRETYVVGINFGNFSPYIANPFGRSSAFSCSLIAQMQHVTKSKLLYGLYVDYESLTSQVAVTTIVEDFSPSFPINGRTTVQNRYLNVGPFVGKRFGNRNLSIDVAAGTDLGIGLSSHEHSVLTGSPSSSTPADANRPIPAVDLRPRLNVTGYYRAFGLSLGYSHGLTNYASGQIFIKETVYSRMWRAGVTYRFGKRV